MKTFTVTYYVKKNGTESEARHIVNAENAKDAVTKTQEFVHNNLHCHAFRPKATPLTATQKEQEKHDLIAKIVVRAEGLGIRKGTRITALIDMDKAADHYALRLRDLLSADDLAFTYDFAGIQSHVDRRTGAFDSSFMPKFAGARESA